MMWSGLEASYQPGPQMDLHLLVDQTGTGCAGLSAGSRLRWSAIYSSLWLDAATRVTNMMISLCWHNSQCLTCLRRCWLFPGLFTNEWAGNQLVARARSACAHWAVVISVLCNNWDWAGSLDLTMPSSSLVTTTHQAFISGLSWETLPFRLVIPKNGIVQCSSATLHILLQSTGTWHTVMMVMTRQI